MLKTLIMKAAFIAFVGSVSFAAHAIAETQRFDVPAGDLVAALESFAKQADVDLVYQDEQVKGFRTGGVSGEFSPRDAVVKLLEGTPLQLRTDEASGALLITTPLPSGGRASSASETRESRPKAAARADSAAVREKNSFWSRFDAFRLAQADPVRRDETQKAANRQPVALEEVVVTGTHIRGIPTTASPLFIYTSKDIERTGVATLADFARTLPQNFAAQTSASANVPQPIFDISFGSGIDLRGLGASSTLVLLNGRRIAGSAGASGSFVNLANIPLATIERVEVSTDGASAIYGSDAIGGVVNIITKKDHEGIETHGRLGTDSAGDAPHWSASATAGIPWSNGNLVLAFEHRDHDPLEFGDREASESRDKRPFGGTDFRNAFSSPGNVSSLVATQNLPGLSSPTAAVPAGQDGTNLDVSSLLPGVVNLGDHSQRVTMVPGEVTNAVYASLQQEILGSVSLFTNVLYSDTEAIFNSNPPAATFVVPAGNPFNPFGAPVQVRYQFAREFPNVPVELQEKSYGVTAGVEGAIGFIGARAGEWHWEISGTVSNNDLVRIVTSLDSAAAAAALADPDPRTSLNVFGDGSAQNRQTMDAILSSHVRADNEAETRAATAKLDGSIFSTSAGTWKAAVGFEYREALLSTGSRNVETGAVSRPPLDADRDVAAAFAEFLIPIYARGGDGLPGLALSLATRYEDYSDFGDSLDPKFGVIWTPAPDISVKASWGTSFKAPQLAQLFSVPLQLPLTIFDPKTGRTVTVPGLFSGGRSDLDAETSESVSVGAKYSMRGSRPLSVEVNYFQIDFEDRILGSVNAFNLISREDLLPPGIFIRDSAGNLVAFNGAPFNASQTSARGFDVSARQEFSLGNVGRLALGLAGTYMFEFDNRFSQSSPESDDVSTLGNPLRWRARANGGVSFGSLTFDVAATYLPSYLARGATPAADARVDDYATVDVTMGWEAPRGSSHAWWEGITMRAGVLNALDEDAPFVNNIVGFDPANASPLGRSVFFELGKRFW